ncbi:hypothetical protein ACSSS7_007415 [Eimeria intestinalis]
MGPQWGGVEVNSQDMTDSSNQAATSRCLSCFLQCRLGGVCRRSTVSTRLRTFMWSTAAALLMLQMLVQPTTAVSDAESGSLLQTPQLTAELEQPGSLDYSPSREDTALPDDLTPASMLQAAAQPSEFSFTTEASPDQPPTSGGSDLPQGRRVLQGVNITVATTLVNGVRTIQVAAYREGEAVAVFNLTSTTETKEKLLRDLSAVADNPDALFTIVWQPTSPTAGTLSLKLESSYNANSSVPSFRHVAGRRLVSERVTASIPKEKLLQIKTILEFKEWLAASCHPPLLKEGNGFQIIVMTLMLQQKSKKRFEVRGEEAALEWLQKVAVRREPIVAVTGELERKATIEIPFFENFTWPQLLRLKGLVDDSEKAGVPLSSMTGTVPSLRVESFSVPPDWFRMTPQQQFEWWSSGRQPGAAGTSPDQMNLSGLFGPQYPSGTTPIFFIDNKGQPLGADREPGNASLFGSRMTPVDKVPDHVFGQFVPAINATIIFPGGTKATHLINPSREWHKLEKSYPNMRASLAPKEPEKNGALLTVKINGTPYHLAGEFVETYPSLLHLLAHLASENPNFLLDSVDLVFGSSVPRSVNAIFVLETPEGVPPWCIFQFEVPITKRNTVLIKSVMKKARRAAESPNGCNITNAKGLRFETLTAVARVEQLQPELKTTDRQQLNFRGSQAECRKMGAIFANAYKSGQTLAVFFSATHLLKGGVEIPRYGKSGEELKPSMKTVSSRVHLNEPWPQLVADFTKPFRKLKVPGMEFPYVQVSGGLEKSALPQGSIPESYYHQTPGKVKITWHPQVSFAQGSVCRRELGIRQACSNTYCMKHHFSNIETIAFGAAVRVFVSSIIVRKVFWCFLMLQFPILGDHDTFTDGNGPHQTGGEVNVPIRPGAAGVVGPFNAIQNWLRHHIPNLQLPMDLERMPAEDRNSFLKKVIVEVEGGEKINLFDILQPLLRSPRWDKFNPADYTVPYHLLTLPVKNVFVEGDLEFVVTTPEGAQISHTLPVRPQESWRNVLDRFYHMFPQYDRATTKLSLFDPAGNPILVPEESPVYVGVKEAVEQHRKGFQITLETPLGTFTTCYRFDESNNKCLVVPMHSLFCGKILGISERAKAWEKQCSAADQFLENALRGADLFRPVRLRDLLALIRKHVASSRPDVIKDLNLPDPAASQVEIERLKAQIDRLRALPQKTAEDYDTLQKYRREIKTIMSKEIKWAAPSSLSFFYVKERGVQKDLIVPIQDANLRNTDEFWKVYHHATRQSMEAANLDFANVYNISFRVLVRTSLFDLSKEPCLLRLGTPMSSFCLQRCVPPLTQGATEREEVKRRIKHLIKEQKQAQKEVSQIKVKVNVSFEVENSEASADSSIEVTLPEDYARGLRIGGKRRTVAQIAKLYNIPRSYFTLDNYPRVVVDSSKGPLPILKIALETVCRRPDGSIAVTPAELAGVLSERGGYAEDDLVFVTTAAGEKLRVPLKTLRQLQPDKVQKFNFAARNQQAQQCHRTARYPRILWISCAPQWKRTLSDITSEAQAKRKEKVEAAFGEKTLLFSVNVGDPTKWKELLAPWLLRLRSFGPLADTAIQLVVRNDQEPNRAFRRSKCQVSTFGELLEYINDFDSLLNACPGLIMVVSKRQPFAFDLGIRTPPPSGFRMWNRAHGDPEKNRRQLERLAAAFEKVTRDTKVSWKFAKHSGTMSPEQIASIQELLQTDTPRDAKLVRMILTALNVPKEEIARLTGRLSILITHDMYISRADGTKLSRLMSAKGNPQTPVNISVPPGDYSMWYSLFSPTRQVNGSPCSIRSANDFQNLTWEKALEWCGLKFEDLAGLKAPFVWIEGSQVSMFPNAQPVSFGSAEFASCNFQSAGHKAVSPEVFIDFARCLAKLRVRQGIPVVTFQNEYPTGFSFQRPGAPISSIMPNDVYFNVVQQPGSNVPGATFVQRAPTPAGDIGTSFKYFGQDPQRWGPVLDPGIASFPKGTTAEFNVYPDPDQEESNKAFSNPSIKSFKIPGFSHLPGMQNNFNASFNPNMPSVPGGELVYIQAPAGKGQYYLCPGITLQQFLTLKSKEEVSKLCNIPIHLLDSDIMVSAYGPEATPNYAPARPSVSVQCKSLGYESCWSSLHLSAKHESTALLRQCATRWNLSECFALLQVVLIDRVQRPHYYTVPWEDNPLKYVEPLLRDGHPEDLMLFSFANSNQCAVSRAMLGNLKSWLELTRFCSETFKSVRPTHIVGVVQPVYRLPPLQITMPEDLREKMIRRHNGFSPENIFAAEPLGVVISNLLVDQPPGFTLETILEMNDGIKMNFNTLPDEWRNIPATQIPGLASITIQDTKVGNLQDLLKQLNIGGQTPYSEFVTKITEEGNRPTGFTVPSTQVHVGGPTAPGAAQPNINFELLQPETIGPSGKPDSFGARFPVAHGSLPETMKMEDVLKMLHNPQVLVALRTSGTLTQSFSLYVTVFSKQRKHARKQGPEVLKSSFCCFRCLLQGQAAPGYKAKTVPSDQKVEVSDLHGTPGMSLVLSFLNALKQVKDIAPGQTISIDAQSLQAPEFQPQGEIPVGDGSVDFRVLNQLYRLPTRIISSKDHTTISELFLQLGKRLQSMLEATPLHNQSVVLNTTFTKKDGTQFSVDTPLGTGEEASRALSQLTLWSLVPEEAVHQHIKHIDMTLTDLPPSLLRDLFLRELRLLLPRDLFLRDLRLSLLPAASLRPCRVRALQGLRVNPVDRRPPSSHRHKRSKTKFCTAWLVPCED